MKEATGELSTTVIAIVAIAAILAVFTALLLPMLRNQIALTQACSNGPGYTGPMDENNMQIVCDGDPLRPDQHDTWTCRYGNSSKQCAN